MLTGTAWVIFPKKFQQDNLLKANAEAKFPGDAAPFQFRLKDPGTETVIAICNATGVGADGIEHDFKTRQFTPLGNYREFLTRQIVVEGASKIASAQKVKAAEDGQAATDADDDGAQQDGVSDEDEVLARTAIKLVVR